MTTFRRATLVGVAAACAACVGQDSMPGDAGPTPDWTAELELRIGSLDDPDYSLTAIRALEVGPDGSIYTLHRSELIVRHFDADGTLIRTIGGRGDGPGEFQSPSRMGFVADTLWVMDTDGYRFSQFGLDGSYLGSFTVPFVMGSATGTDNPPRAIGLLEDGTVYGAPPTWSNGIADGTITHRVYMLMTRDGAVTDTLPGIRIGRSQWTISSPDGRGGFYRSLPFPDGPLGDIAPGERALVVVERGAPVADEGATARVSKVDFGGDTLFTRELVFDAVPVRREALDSVLDEVAGFIAERGIFGYSRVEARRAAEAGLYTPAFRAGVRTVVLGRDGTIWLAREIGESETTPWLVLDGDGETLGGVSLPAELTIHRADYPFVWGVETDELDVPYVVRYRMTSPMIAMGDADGKATLSAIRVVARPQDSRQSRARPSPANPDLS